MSAGWYDELVEEARRVLPPHVFHYVSTGAGDGVTTQEAAEAWRAVRLLPRVLHDVRDVDTTTTFLGRALATPIAVAPTSLQRLVHTDGELAMLEGAREAGALTVVSSNAGTTFAEIGAVGAAWWLQAYLTAERSLIAPVLERAARAGASAVVLTVDTPFPGPKRDVDDAAFGDLSRAYGVNHPDAIRGLTAGAEHAQDLGPHDIGWVRDVTGLPVVAKGVLRADDARRCVDAGAAAVLVSNHGGRQLDRAVSTAAALGAVVRAVGAEAEVYVDGGIRSGSDVVAALALGAGAVFVGRPALYGLATGGARGVSAVLARLGNELADALRLAGCAILADTRDLAVPGAPSAPDLRKQ